MTLHEKVIFCSQDPLVLLVEMQQYLKNIHTALVSNKHRAHITYKTIISNDIKSLVSLKIVSHNIHLHLHTNLV